MRANLEAKKVLLEEIKDKIKRSKSITVVDYTGVTVAEDTKLRKAFRNAGADYKVYKNRLMMLALKELGIDSSDEQFNGLSAFAFSFTDEVAAPKIVATTAKEINKLAIKFGVLNGQIVNKEEIEILATLPSKEVLIATLLGTLLAPATNLACVLNAPTAAFARALNAIATK